MDSVLAINTGFGTGRPKKGGNGETLHVARFGRGSARLFMTRPDTGDKAGLSLTVRGAAILQNITGTGPAANAAAHLQPSKYNRKSRTNKRAEARIYPAVAEKIFFI